MTPLHLLQLRFDEGGLYDHARRRGRRHIQLDDPGYLMHMVLAELFGKDAILGFRLKPGTATRDGAPQLTVLAYSHHDLATLMRQADMTAEPDLVHLWHRGDSYGKPMPTEWPTDQRLGFEVLAYPVRRVGSSTMAAGAQPVRDRKDPRATYEVDAWLAEKLKEDARWRAEGRDPKDNPGPPREPVYRQWLVDQLRLRPESGAEIQAAEAEAVALESFQRDRFWRPRHGEGSGSTRDRPLVLYRGTLRITDPAAFAQLLARGIGRHRAFGLGMLLLRPV